MNLAFAASVVGSYLAGVQRFVSQMAWWKLAISGVAISCNLVVQRRLARLFSAMASPF
jgi:hypothetical protein